MYAGGKKHRRKQTPSGALPAAQGGCDCNDRIRGYILCGRGLWIPCQRPAVRKSGSVYARCRRPQGSAFSRHQRIGRHGPAERISENGLHYHDSWHRADAAGRDDAGAAQGALY